MALMRFRSQPQSRRLVGAGTDVRQVEHLGDAPAAPPEPNQAAWSISSYPYPATHDALGRRIDDEGDESG